MLTTLRIKNFALVEDLTLELQPGYNVITGETGAGKSIFIGALNLTLGERADRHLIRTGADSCLVEAVFDLEKLGAPIAKYLEENGLEPCEHHQLLLKRTLTSGGANRQFINGSPATLAQLAAIGQWLVDIHGPHEHQSLLRPAKQLSLLDAFGDLVADRENLAGVLRRENLLVRQKQELIVDENTYHQQLDLLRFQAREISDAALQADEEISAEAEYRRASNSARLLELTQSAREVLGETDNSIPQQIAVLGRQLQDLQRLDPHAVELSSLQAQAVSLLQDLQNSLLNYQEKVETDPETLRKLEDRLNLLQSLKRKYGSTTREMIAFGENARRKLETLEQRDAELDRLNKELAKVRFELWKLAEELSQKRAKHIPLLCKAVSKQMSVLGFKQSRFEISLSRSEAGTAEKPGAVTSSGIDRVEFEFSPNPGEPLRPLRAIGSSGELARVMLAIKTVLAQEDDIPVLVFDEVDANVGGETAKAVGEKMAEIARNRQVLCITHLPQVAAPAGAHYVAEKTVKSGRTISEIRLLNRKERVEELTRMLGGQSQAARQHAEAMLE
jgi:DNA repair protein RecN (Recombination protein N)